MKTVLRLCVSLVTGALALASAMPALAVEAPATQAPAPEAKQSAASNGKPEVRRKVAPHNHMRDAKGVWVPEKRPAKEKKDASEADEQVSAKEQK